MPAPTTPQMHEFAPILPVELIDDILQIATPSKHQLARICLISKQFLWPARKLLYDSLELLYQPVKPRLVLPRTDTFFVLRTLERNADLRQLPTSISFYSCQGRVYDTVSPARKRDTVIQTVLSLAPKVDRINLDHYFSVPASIVSSKIVVHKTLTSLSIACLSLDTPESFRQLQGIRKLRVDDWIVGKRERLSLALPELRVLDLRRGSELHPSFLSRRLTVLRISLESEMIDFSLLPDLKHLWLRLPWDGSNPLGEPRFDKLVHLQDLFLDRPGYATRNMPPTVLDDLIATPPPQKICLTFPCSVPSITIVKYLDSSASFVASELRIPPGYYYESSSLESLSTSCKRKDVKLSSTAADSRFDVFRL